MKKISSRSREVAEKIRDLEPFQTYGSLYATEQEVGLGYWSSGQLRGYDLEVFKRDMGIMRYVVWSYSTPIAWWSPARGWHVVRQTFSVTTSRHQGNLYLITGPGSEAKRWQPWFDASVGSDDGRVLACRRVRGEHSGPVGYTDDGTLCQRHYEMRPAVKRMLEGAQHG